MILQRVVQLGLFLIALPGPLAIGSARGDEAADRRFREDVAPLLQAKCLGCHNSNENQGRLSLENRQQLLAGGSSGPAVEPGSPSDSYLLDLVTPVDGKAEMPQGEPPLTEAELATLRRWLAEGAAWPEDVVLHEPQVQATDWWSLLPLSRPGIPALPASRRAWVRTPVDAFIAARHERENLQPAPEADRRTLIRRLSFDLVGLPPSPDDVDAFVADDNPQAYERLVDRLLDSPHYGERWARHWLDVVHFGETHGYDKDKLRLNAWPYRDYVIRSFNDDKPYGRFVAEQVAGDVLYPDTVDGIEALGFIAAGPWDFIGHAEVPETKIDGKVARHLDRDDMVANTINTFCSLTVHCAQCHNHKFDPIAQEDYYSLQAVFAALDRADKAYDVDPQTRRQRLELTAQKTELAARKQELEGRVTQLGGADLAALDTQIRQARQPPSERPPQHGYHSQIERSADAAKWVQIDLGESVAIERLTWVACYDDFNGIGAGFGYPVRFRIEVSGTPEFGPESVVVFDRTGADVPNPGTALQSADVGGKSARWVRFTATKLAPRQNDFIFALSELSVLDAAGKNQALGKPVAALDSIEAPIRWGRQNLVDGIFPGGTKSPEDLQTLQQRREELLQRVVEPAIRNELTQVAAKLGRVDADLKALPPQRVVFAGTVHTGSGAFTGTGASGGKPRPIHILNRGSVQSPGREVAPGSLSALGFSPSRFDSTLGQPEGTRRAALAEWLSHRENPLTWRSIVNRAWQFHFGRGLVDTPNDFGRMGQLPTHPELLEWLAVEFRDGGQSLKQLHRLLVTSAVYRQSAESPFAADQHQRDGDNESLWHANRRRLDAESIRDSLLAVSGRLDAKMGGPSFQDFVIEHPEHSPHFEYHLHDPEDPRSMRRSVYRFLVRSKQQPFMATLDCADPSMLVEKRNETITPLQALTLLNNQLTVVLAKHFAEQVSVEAQTPAEQVRTAFRTALSREPTAEESAALTEYVQQFGLANACRVILNLNEFVFVD